METVSEQAGRRRKRGPKVVAIGGGTGLSTMLRGLKEYTENLTAIVAVTDDGGGSGMLRQDLGMLPPGDIRNCMEALANVEPIMQQLMSYRFTEGSLTGQSFGNLLLAALNGISDSFDQAVARMSQVLAISGRVLPVSNANVQLAAVFENGVRVVGESRIVLCKKQQNCRIARVELAPGRAAALPDTIRAIEEADLILLGPGSLYTSVIPNVLVDGVTEAICRSDAMKVYVCNIMTQDGETEGMTAGDHVAALMDHSAPGVVDICLANSAELPATMLEKYREEDAAPIIIDRDKLERLGVEVVERPLTDSRSDLARHSSRMLAQAAMELYEARSMRIFNQEDEYIMEDT